jgi:hypothetical protein
MIAFLGISNVELSMNRGPGRADAVFRRVLADGTIVYVFVDIKSNAGFGALHENPWIRQAAVSAASMPNTRVHVIWASWHPYTTNSGQVISAAMQAAPNDQIRGANRALFLCLNLLGPMLTAPPGTWEAVPRPTLAIPHVTFYEYLCFNSQRFPLYDTDMGIALVTPANLAVIVAGDPAFMPQAPLPPNVLARSSDLTTGGPHTMSALVWLHLNMQCVL